MSNQARQKSGQFGPKEETLSEVIGVRVTTATMTELNEKIPQEMQPEWLRSIIKAALKKVKAKKD